MVQDNSSIQAGRRMLRPCFGFRPAVLEFYGWNICKIRNPTRYLVQFTTSESTSIFPTHIVKMYSCRFLADATQMAKNGHIYTYIYAHHRQQLLHSQGSLISPCYLSQS